VDEASIEHWQSLVYGRLNRTYSIARNAWPVVMLDQAWLSHYDRMLDEPFKMVCIGTACGQVSSRFLTVASLH
jgi:hypothetical protein